MLCLVKVNVVLLVFISADPLRFHEFILEVEEAKLLVSLSRELGSLEIVVVTVFRPIVCCCSIEHLGD